MKALTICQPYAHLIITGKKFVENREWETLYRGPLLIHAGKSKAWLELDDITLRDVCYDIHFSDLTFGAIVGIADLVHCYHKDQLQELADRRDPLAASVLAHEHTHGTFCWTLQNVRRFPTPIPYKGAQGLFTIPDHIVADQLRQAVGV